MTAAPGGITALRPGGTASRWSLSLRWPPGSSRAGETTMRYDRARTSLDRHATYIVAAYVAGAAR
jgi:hypothetical protein